MKYEIIEIDQNLINEAKKTYQRTIQHCLDLIEELENYKPELAEDNEALRKTIESCKDIMTVVKNLK